MMCFLGGRKNKHVVYHFSFYSNLNCLNCLMKLIKILLLMAAMQTSPPRGSAHETTVFSNDKGKRGERESRGWGRA